MIHDCHGIATIHDYHGLPVIYGKHDRPIRSEKQQANTFTFVSIFNIIPLFNNIHVHILYDISH